MPSGQAGSVVWPTDISRAEFNRFRRIGDVLGRFAAFQSDVGIRMTIAEIENEVAGAQSITNDKLLDQDRLMLTENDEVLGVRGGRPYTKYEDEWKKRFAEIEKLPEGFVYPASRRRFLRWMAANKQRWQLGVETKVQQRRSSKISADSDKLGDMIATRLNVEDEVRATGRTELEVRERRLRALADQNVALNVWDAEQGQGFVEQKMKLAREAHSTAIENEVLGGALSIRNEDGEVNLIEAHKFIDAETELTPEERIDVKRKLTAAVAQDDAAKFQQWTKMEGEKRDEWYDNLRAGQLAELQSDLDTFDSQMTGKWKSREVALKSEFQGILDRRIKAEAAVQEKWQALEDPFNREIFGEITEARTQSDLDRTALKVGGYVKSRKLSVTDAKARQTEIGQRREQLAEQAADWEVAGDLETMAYDVWRGVEREENVLRKIDGANALGTIADGTRDRLRTIVQGGGKQYQGTAMQDADDLIDEQLITVTTSILDALTLRFSLATGTEKDRIGEEQVAKGTQRQIEQWNAARTRDALSGWLLEPENKTADALAIKTQARRLIAEFNKDVGVLSEEMRRENAALLRGVDLRSLPPGVVPRETDVDAVTRAAAGPGRRRRRGKEPAGRPPETRLPRPGTQAEIDALPPGSEFVWTDGKTYRKD